MASSPASIQAAKQALRLLVSGKWHESALRNVNITSASPGKLSCELTANKEHVNTRGALSGAFVSVLFNAMTTVALASSPAATPGATVDESLSLLKSARIGDKLTLGVEVIKTAKSLIYTKIELFNDNGDVIAQGKLIKHVGKTDEKIDSVDVTVDG